MKGDNGRKRFVHLSRSRGRGRRDRSKGKSRFVENHMTRNNEFARFETNTTKTFFMGRIVEKETRSGSR